jgi:hypothetical protein
MLVERQLVAQGQGSMAAVVNTRSIKKTRQGAVVVWVSAAVLVLCAAIWQLWGGTAFGYEYSCSRAGQRDLQQSQEGFVRAHFSDATSVEVLTYDCDSGDSAVLAFSTTRSPVAARDILLTDPACLSQEPEPSGDENVECQSGSDRVWISLTAADGGTAGELSVSS